MLQDNKYLERFILSHEHTYEIALKEVRNGRKETHWMWWIFPQMAALGKSERSKFYGFPNRDKAAAFLAHPLLGQHLREITQAAYDSDKAPYEIFGSDVIKFRSCMLLFDSIETNSIFTKVLRKWRWK